MNWKLYPNLYYFIKKLPQYKTYQVEFNDHQQSVTYDEKKIPVKKIEKLYLPFQKNIQAPSSIQSYNESLWKIMCKYIHPDYILTSKSYQNENTMYLIRNLKNFIVEPNIRSIITGRRMYSILEMLDKPVTEFTRNHQNAIGFFFSYILGYKIKIDNDVYAYQLDSDKSITLIRNVKGFWYEPSDKN